VISGEAILFVLFAGVALGGAIMVVTMRNPMYSALSLLASFLAVAALFVLRHAEFLGIVQVFVYGGGIMVLFLFVLMLVNLQQVREVSLFLGQSKLAGAVILVMAAFFVFLFTSTIDFGPAFTDPDSFKRVDGEILGNSEAVAWILYRDYLLPFEIASVLLVAAMIGAIVLVRED